MRGRRSAEATAREALAGLKASTSGDGAAAGQAGGQAAAAVTAFDRFIAVNQEIVGLSRRNSNVRSLALSLGRKRTVVAQGEEIGRLISQAVEHGVTERRPWYEPSERLPDQPVVNVALNSELDTVVVELPNVRNIATPGA